MNERARIIAKKHFKMEWENLHETERHVITHIVEGTPVTQLPPSLIDDKLTPGQRLADRMSKFGGSWPFIAIFMGILVIWVALNSFFLTRIGEVFDPYPYILLNLFLSMIAALQAPIIMMSQNRLAYKDREQSLADYEVNLKAELEIRIMHEKVDELIQKRWAELLAVQEEQTAILRKMGAGKK